MTLAADVPIQRWVDCNLLCNRLLVPAEVIVQVPMRMQAPWFTHAAFRGVASVVTQFAKVTGTGPGPAWGAQLCTRRHLAVILGSTAVQRLLPAPATRALPVEEGSALTVPRMLLSRAAACSLGDIARTRVSHAILRSCSTSMSPLLEETMLATYSSHRICCM